MTERGNADGFGPHPEDPLQHTVVVRHESNLSAPIMGHHPPTRRWGIIVVIALLALGIGLVSYSTVQNHANVVQTNKRLAALETYVAERKAIADERNAAQRKTLKELQDLIDQTAHTLITQGCARRAAEVAHFKGTPIGDYLAYDLLHSGCPVKRSPLKPTP